MLPVCAQVFSSTELSWRGQALWDYRIGPRQFTRTGSGSRRMGVESANYVYVPTRESADLLAGTLNILGARMVDNDNELIVQWVLRGNDYWIDVEVMCAGGLTYPSASIRVALCNPAGVALALRNLLE